MAFDHGVRVPWAIESGSRAWGFASPDSDYDCRFFFVRPSAAYAALWPARDVIETPLEGLLDVNGWDLGKAIRLATAGNATVGEWLRSPWVYDGDPAFRDESAGARGPRRRPGPAAPPLPARGSCAVAAGGRRPSHGRSQEDLLRRAPGGHAALARRPRRRATDEPRRVCWSRPTSPLTYAWRWRSLRERKARTREPGQCARAAGRRALGRGHLRCRARPVGAALAPPADRGGSRIPSTARAVGTRLRSGV
ncbi:nucleotidyltransferase domain-containing protein [Nocardioides convexus]|uniref:nucleotidyltransferase domain-containing protein n=1 Tax=Nocardioides convexus TaxID=2712224 RepID=UPI002418B0F8|nr:nucleotidyltransferase domain-containing protein [Nocardioides convexus]